MSESSTPPLPAFYAPFPRSLTTIPNASTPQRQPAAPRAVWVYGSGRLGVGSRNKRNGQREHRCSGSTPWLRPDLFEKKALIVGTTEAISWLEQQIAMTAVERHEIAVSVRLTLLYKCAGTIVQGQPGVLHQGARSWDARVWKIGNVERHRPDESALAAWFLIRPHCLSLSNSIALHSSTTHQKKGRSSGISEACGRNNPKMSIGSRCALRTEREVLISQVEARSLRSGGGGGAVSVGRETSGRVAGWRLGESVESVVDDVRSGQENRVAATRYTCLSAHEITGDDECAKQSTGGV
ncbi:hypothetical protein BC835DRAFT_1306033 [Cytidiella melzeri]|nr:hypothetical protein BC835DRAFT_1306033 [Cytidiella melzeri]